MCDENSFPSFHFASSLLHSCSTTYHRGRSLKKMSAPSDQLSLPLPLFSSSSNFKSTLRPVHSSDCSLRLQKNMIRIKEEWWGPTIKDSVVSSIQEEREMDKGNKRRRSNAIVRAGEEYNGESSYVGKQHEANSVALEPGDNLNSSKSRNNSRRDLRPPSFSESRSPRVYANPSTATSRKKKRSSRASRSHPWLSSRPAPPPPRRFATPPLSSLRSAVSVLDTPIVILQETMRHSSTLNRSNQYFPSRSIAIKSNSSLPYLLLSTGQTESGQRSPTDLTGRN